MPRRGRPRAADALTRERIVSAALQCAVESGWGALSLRAVARSLGVDPMALYHHFPDKSALLAAAAAVAFVDLDPGRPPWTEDAPWTERLSSLTASYVALGRADAGIVLALASDPVAVEALAGRWRALVGAALAGMGADVDTAADVLADLAVGHIVAARPDAESLARQLSLVCAGIEATAARRRR